MPKAKKKWFIIKAGSAQVYSYPDFNSSCITEAIYGESCRILRHKDNWFKIECEDGYIGWVNSFYGIRSLERNKPKYLVVYPNDGGCFISKYPFGSQMENYISGSMLINKKLGSDKVIDVATHLLGIPYKWGGKSSLGFDCSGLVQSVLKICGLQVPRDAKDQLIFFKNDITIFWDFVSSWLVASSSIKILGSFINVLAIAILCLSPPESELPKSPTLEL